MNALSLANLRYIFRSTDILKREKYKPDKQNDSLYNGHAVTAYEKPTLKLSDISEKYGLALKENTPITNEKYQHAIKKFDAINARNALEYMRGGGSPGVLDMQCMLIGLADKVITLEEYEDAVKEYGINREVKRSFYLDRL